MAASQKKQLALDTNLLLDLAEEKEFAHDFIDQFRQRGYTLLIPPTVLTELAFFAELGNEPQADLANIALDRSFSWQCQAFTLSSAELATSCEFSMKLIGKALLPEEERNDGQILAQSSLAEIPLLITSDKHLLQIEQSELLLAFHEVGLGPAYPVRPKRLLRALY